MTRNRKKYMIHFSRQRKVRSFESNRDGKAHGPKFVCYSDGTLKEFANYVGTRRVGTEHAWIDTGNKNEEVYFPCDLGNALIARLYIIELLDITLLDQGSSNIHERWIASESFPEPRDLKDPTQFPRLNDPTAESRWCTTEDEGLSDELPRWPNGQIAFLGCRYGNFPSGAVVTFWESGAVRTVAHWDDDGVVGTRSCFDDNGNLTAEQNFFRNGWNSGCWIDRHFTWEDDFPMLSRVDIFKGFELVKTIDTPVVRSIWDEAMFNRECDPLYGKLRRQRYDPIINQFIESEEDEDLVDWKEIAQRQCELD